MKLTPEQKRLLLAISGGSFLKSHRYPDGEKLYQLHPLDGPAQAVDWGVVEALTEQGLIDSNKKFPAATYWLTDKGRAAVAALAEQA